MLIYHAALCDDQFLLWGETREALAVAAARRKKPRARPDVLLLPYSAAPKQLLAGTSETIGLRFSLKASATRYAWLPTCESGPLPSSPLIADMPAPSGEVILAPWEISAQPLSDREIVDLLGACSGRQILGPGLVIGDDLAFWIQALRFAGALVARQNFLPEIRETSSGFRACWAPVLDPQDQARLAKLAGTMPASARAMTTEVTTPPEIPALLLLRRFVEGLVDYLVRSGPSPAPAPKGKGRKGSQSFDSMHEQWIHALQSPDGEMPGDHVELSRFASQVREWEAPITISLSSPFRLCFRLDEPDAGDEPAGVDAGTPKTGGDGTWQVRYLLQAVDDPSLLVPAGDAWRPRSQLAKIFRSRSFDPRQFLLSGLGQASGICPEIEASLKSSSPGAFLLDSAGAHEFLTHRAQALERAGFAIMLPAWWTRKGTKLQLSARARVQSAPMQASAGLSMDQIIRFEVELALGGEPISIEELEALAQLKSPLVRLRGQWIELNAAEIQAALDFWKKKAEGAVPLRQIALMALGAEQTVGGIHFQGITANGWIGDFLDHLEGRAELEELPTPTGFHGELRPYQVRGFSWLSFLKQWGLGACLADDMGLGKTIQALALVQRDRELNGRHPVLLICPTSVMGNWHKETTRFCPDLPVLTHHGGTRIKGAGFRKAAKKQALVISSYALLHRDLELFQRVKWAGLILDEAQNIKNPETKQARAARSIEADYRIALTGTPVENNVGDLWSVMEYLNPGFLGSPAEFRRKFFIPIQAQRDADAMARLRRLTAPFTLRRLKTDRSIIADLPEKMEMKVFCTLTKEQASLYKAVVDDVEEAMVSAEGIQRKGLILATLSKLKQVCNHPAQFLGDSSDIPGRSGKLARLVEMLEEILEVGDRALVFSQFAEMGTILQRHLQETFGREVFFLHGGVPRKRRDEMVERFQDVAGPGVFILSLKAGGTGLNLTRASHVFHFDRWWNPAVENQATDRAFRIGQLRNVQVHKFLCAGTLEEKIDDMIEAKKEIAERVVGTGEGWLTELSTDQLRELFVLRKEAIGE